MNAFSTPHRSLRPSVPPRHPGIVELGRTPPMARVFAAGVEAVVRHRLRQVQEGLVGPGLVAHVGAEERRGQVLADVVELAVVQGRAFRALGNHWTAGSPEWTGHRHVDLA